MYFNIKIHGKFRVKEFVRVFMESRGESLDLEIRQTAVVLLNPDYESNDSDDYMITKEKIKETVLEATLDSDNN